MASLPEQDLLEFSSQKLQSKVKEEPIDETEIVPQQVDDVSGKVLDYQFLVHPKQEPIEVKTEFDTLALTGEIIDPFGEDWVALTRNVLEEPYYPEDKYFCKECNREFPFKKHDLHLEYIKILNSAEKPNTQRKNYPSNKCNTNTLFVHYNNKYSCKECNITFDTVQNAVKHLFAHDQSFDCSFCIYVGKTLSEFKCHLKLTHPDLLVSSKSNPIIHCKECDFKTNHQATMSKHVNAEHTSFMVKCKHCNEYWPDDDHTLHEMIKHITRKEITTENPFVCKECDIKFVDTIKIYKHLRIHDDIGYYCNFCSFNADKRRDLEDHKQNEHLDEMNEQFKQTELSSEDSACTICNRLWPDKNHETHLRMLKIEKRGVSDTQPYRCSGCCKSITDIKRVYFHLRLGCKKLHCDKCSYMAMLPWQISKHKMKVHPKPNQVRQYKYFCDVCDYKTDQIKYLSAHQRRHMDESEKVYFDCDLCNFKTTDKRYLKIHKRRIHEGSDKKEMISCPDCPYVTSYIMHLQLHRKRAHGNVLYNCPDCPFQTRTKKYLDNHKMWRHSISKKDKIKTEYICELCGIKYKFKPTLRRHIINIHNIQPANAKKYTCDICNYETIIKTEFSTHLRNKHQEHNKQKMYCANCDYSTFIKTNLIQHMVKHADPSKMKMHKCTICSFTTKRAHTLRHHIKTHGVA